MTYCNHYKLLRLTRKQLMNAMECFITELLSYNYQIGPLSTTFKVPQQSGKSDIQTLRVILNPMVFNACCLLL
jgi:hypothetical protein